MADKVRGKKASVLTSDVKCSKQAVHHDPNDAQWSLIFQAFGGFLDFLQCHFCIIKERFVIHELAHAALAFVHLLQNLFKVCHGSGGFMVKRLVFDQLSDGPLSFIDIADDVSCFVEGEFCVFHERFDVAGGAIEVGHGCEGGVIKAIVADELADGSFALGNLRRNCLQISEDRA